MPPSSPVRQFSKRFIKQWRAMPRKKQDKIIDSINLFEKDPANPKLRNHQLEGELTGIWSISAGGDLRIHYQRQGDTVIFFLATGSHSQLYR